MNVLGAAALVGLFVGMQSSANAAIVFSDNFDSYAYQLNWAPPANWTAPGPGTVDLIGETATQTQFNFYPAMAAMSISTARTEFRVRFKQPPLFQRELTLCRSASAETRGVMQRPQR
jgi:hypothetical protein